MSIKAKGRTIFRIIGAILILIGLGLSFLLSYLFINDYTSYLMVVFICLPWVLFSTFLKLELEIVINFTKKILIIMITYNIVLFILIIVGNILISISIFLNTLFILLLLGCWHFSLSLYKKEKKIFIFGGIFYNIDIILIGFVKNMQGNPIFVITIIIECFGIILIIVIEINLSKKGYLNYI